MIDKNYRTDYLNIHDNRYKRLRKQGKIGWNGDDALNVLNDTLSTIEIVITKYSIDTRSRLLELGCGNGCLTLELRKKGFDCYGIDISPTAIEWAKETAKENSRVINYNIGNVLKLPYSDKFFDIIIDGHCLHCIIDDDRELFFNEAHRVLKPGGIFLIMTMCGEPAGNILQKFEYNSGNLIYNGIAGRYIGKPNDILNEIKLAEFNILEWTVKTENDIDQQANLIVIAGR